MEEMLHSGLVPDESESLVNQQTCNRAVWHTVPPQARGPATIDGTRRPLADRTEEMPFAFKLSLIHI